MSIASFAFFNGWTRRDRVFGVDLVRSDRPDDGVVRCSFPSAPLLPAARLVRTMLAEMRPRMPTVAFVAAERGQTHEGDHFVLLTLREALPSPVSPASMERRVGLIYGDRLMALVDGIFRPQARDMFCPIVDELTREFPMRDGTWLRVRRYFTTVPAGWATRTRDLTTYLHAPGNRAAIEILPAQPAGTGSVAQAFLYEDTALPLPPRDALDSRLVVTPAGLTATLLRPRPPLPSAPLVAGGALLRDERFRYVLRFKAEAAAFERHWSDFVDVAMSVQPVGVPAGGTVADDNSYWTG